MAASRGSAHLEVIAGQIELGASDLGEQNLAGMGDLHLPVAGQDGYRVAFGVLRHATRPSVAEVFVGWFLAPVGSWRL